MRAQPAVLTIGDRKETLIVVRSLARAGFKLIVGKRVVQGLSYARHSRYASETWEHPDFDRGEELIRAIRAFLTSRRDIRCVVPIGDKAVWYFARHWLELPESPAFLMPPANAVLRCLDKIQMYDFAVQQGIPTAVYTHVYHAWELPAAAESLGFPCVIKPRHSPKPVLEQQKALICHSARDLRKWLPALPDYCPMVVQTFALGNRRNCHFVAKRGHILAYFEQKVLRTDNADGNGVGIDSVSEPPTPALFEHTAKLAKELEYSGVGTAQFLFEENTGEIHFLEVNPRFDSTIALPYQCGFDIPLMALKACADPHLPARINCDYCLRKRVHWLTKDIFSAASRVLRRGRSLHPKARSVIQVVNSWWNSDCHMTFEWSDPMPTLCLFLQAGSYLRRRRSGGVYNTFPPCQHSLERFSTRK